MRITSEGIGLKQQYADMQIVNNRTQACVDGYDNWSNSNLPVKFTTDLILFIVTK